MKKVIIQLRWFQLMRPSTKIGNNISNYTFARFRYRHETGTRAVPLALRFRNRINVIARLQHDVPPENKVTKVSAVDHLPIDLQAASAQRSPSIAAETIPPA